MHKIAAKIDMPFFEIKKGDTIEVRVVGDKVVSPSGLSWTVAQLRNEFERGIWCESSDEPSNVTAPRITII